MPFIVNGREAISALAVERRVEPLVSGCHRRPRCPLARASDNVGDFATNEPGFLFAVALRVTALALCVTWTLHPILADGVYPFVTCS